MQNVFTFKVFELYWVTTVW